MANEIRNKILIVEDDPGICTFLRAVLSSDGYDAIVVSSGSLALDMIASHCPDCILLDLGLPDMDGAMVIERVRQWTSTPIVVISARSMEQDKAGALDLGADDYITKPFDPAEVLARVRSHLRRYTRLGAQPAAERGNVYTVGPIRLDDEAKRVTLDGEPVSLTPMEYSILRLLIKHPGRIYSSAQIYERIWHERPVGAENAVSVHIRHLRQKLEIDPSQPRYLKVVWGLGYKLEGGREG